MIVLGVLRCRQCHVMMGVDDNVLDGEVLLDLFVCWVIVWLGLYFGIIEIVFIMSIFVIVLMVIYSFNYINYLFCD